MFDKSRKPKPAPSTASDAFTPSDICDARPDIDWSAGLGATLNRIAALRTAEELARLSATAFGDLHTLYQHGLDRDQTAALDRSLAALQQLDELAVQLAADTPSSFCLSELFNDVCSLYCTTDTPSGTAIIPVVYDDLADHYHGDPTPLRTLLYQLCTSLIDQASSEPPGNAQGVGGPLLLRAMLDDQESSDGHGEALLISLELPDCPTQVGPPPASVAALTEQTGARLSIQRQAAVEWRLHIDLPATDPATLPGYAKPFEQPLLYYHPNADGHHALGQRLRRLRFNTLEAADLDQLRTQQYSAAAVVLAASGSPGADTIQTISRSLSVPLMVLGDGPLDSADLPGDGAWLPACVDDDRLRRSLITLVRRHLSSGPLPVIAPEAAAELTGGDRELSRRLLKMLTDDLPETLGNLRHTLDQGDRKGLKDRIHKLKGGASYCGVPALHQAAVRLDQAALAAPTAQLELYLARLTDEAAILLQTLAQQEKHRHAH